MFAVATDAAFAAAIAAAVIADELDDFDLIVEEMIATVLDYEFDVVVVVVAFEF